jgi:hypothetical protein
MKEPYRVLGLAKVGNDGSSDDREGAFTPRGSKAVAAADTRSSWKIPGAGDAEEK